MRLFNLIIFVKKITQNLFNKNISLKNNLFKINFENDSSKIDFPIIKISGGKDIYIGKNVYLGKFCWLEAISVYKNYLYNPKINICDNVVIGNFSCITSINNIKIGSGTLISEYFYVSDHYHGFNPESNDLIIDQPLISKGSVIIGENCFIGFRVNILSGVELGHHCVVGANSVVNKSFPPYSMVAGVPAKTIKKYSFVINDWVDV